jgi:hypothetical protein
MLSGSEVLVQLGCHSSACHREHLCGRKGCALSFKLQAPWRSMCLHCDQAAARCFCAQAAMEQLARGRDMVSTVVLAVPHFSTQACTQVDATLPPAPLTKLRFLACAQARQQGMDNVQAPVMVRGGRQKGFVSLALRFEANKAANPNKAQVHLTLSTLPAPHTPNLSHPSPSSDQHRAHPTSNRPRSTLHPQLPTPFSTPHTPKFKHTVPDPPHPSHCPQTPQPLSRCSSVPSKPPDSQRAATQLDHDTWRAAPCSLTT